MKILAQFQGEREVVLIERRPIGRKPSYTNSKPQEKRYSIYVEDVEYIWLRRKKHALTVFETLKEELSQTKKN